MLPYSVLISLSLIAQVPASQPAPQMPLAVQVGLFSYRADGTNTASATTGGIEGAFEGTVYVAPSCGMGATSKEPPAAASVAWHITGQVIEVAGDSATVQLDWQRSKDNGDTVAGPVSSQRLTLQRGMPVTLDAAPSDGSCDVVRVALEARLTPRAAFAGRGGGISRGAGAVSVTPSGGGARAGAAQGSAGGFARMGSGQAAAGPAPAMFDVELWLVRQSANGGEIVTPLQVRTPAAGGRFEFPPVAMPTDRGVLTVRVTGSFAFQPGAEPARQLTFSMLRSVALAPAGAAVRDRPPESTGSSESTGAMPRPGDVLSYEMPPLRVPNGGPDLPDRFSVRMRVTPVR